ncbi:hypothetical protein [Moorena sp. SIO3I6]|uniref:hypothetical protein n=1 Tax=Moorena sp. SIO3I6 TaxID=2607831 RepID=UPI0013FA1C74|nr:hypothetical protein [Moorena sp. SIO3I6]NEP21756.1 hypothetical protein [Moorena sp. SIO3I6]
MSDCIKTENCDNFSSLLPTPYSLLPTPYSLLPTPYSLFPTPYSLLPTMLFELSDLECHKGDQRLD